MEQQASSLTALQSWMQSMLIDPAGEKNEASGLEIINSIINPSARMKPAERLFIYQRGYKARLLECLSAQFRVLRQILGDGLFKDFCSEYLLKYPSQSYTLGHLGQRFSRFLRESSPADVSSGEPSWIRLFIELAELEWCIYELFDMPAPPDYVPATAATAEPGNLVLSSDLRLFAFSFPVHLYYKSKGRHMPKAKEAFLAVIRNDTRVGVQELNVIQYRFLTLMQDQTELRECLLTTAASFSLAPAAMQRMWTEWRALWVNQGFFLTKDRAAY